MLFRRSARASYLGCSYSVWKRSYLDGVWNVLSVFKSYDQNVWVTLQRTRTRVCGLPSCGLAVSDARNPLTPAFLRFLFTAGPGEQRGEGGGDLPGAEPRAGGS